MHLHAPTAIAAVLTAAIVAGAARAANSRTGPITKFSGVDEIVFACTSGTTYTNTNMPQMARTFAVGAGGTTSVVVTFAGSASLSGQPFDTGFVRLRIDNVTVPPGDIPLIGVDERGTHGFTWESGSLSAGNHTARVQWRTDLGSSLCVDARSLTILHK